MAIKIRTNARFSRFADGFLMGAGAAINVPLGWVPKAVRVFNLTDGTRDDIAPIGTVMAFTSGGVNEVTEGSYIKDVTSLAIARVDQVILASGTWAGGDAAGWFILKASSIVGTFGSHNVIIYDGVNAVVGATDDATVSAPVTYELSTILAVAAVASNKIIRYAGVAGSDPEGFTIGSDSATSGKLLYWQAEGD